MLTKTERVLRWLVMTMIGFTLGAFTMRDHYWWRIAFELGFGALAILTLRDIQKTTGGLTLELHNTLTVDVTDRDGDGTTTAIGPKTFPVRTVELVP